MIFQLLFSIGIFIILNVIMFTYISYYLKMNNINQRQNVFILAFICAFLSLLFEILEGMFYAFNIEIVYSICWRLHWTAAIVFFSLLYYYFRLFDLAELEKCKTFLEVFWNKEKFDFKSAYFVFCIIVSLIGFIFTEPFELGKTLEFTPMSSMWIIVILGIIITISTFRFHLNLKHDNNETKANKFYYTSTVIIWILVTYAILKYPTFPTFGFSLLYFICIFYYHKENFDLLATSDLAKLKASIDNASNSKLEFLYSMSHDIRSPMNAIVGLSDSLRRIENFDEKLVKEDIESINYSCHNLVGIINNILDVNTIIKGKENVTESEYSLSTLVSDFPNVMKARI